MWPYFAIKIGKYIFFAFFDFFSDFSKPKKFRKNVFFEIKNFEKRFFFEIFSFRKIEKKSKNAKKMYFPIFIAKYGHNIFVPHDRNVPFR